IHDRLPTKANVIAFMRDSDISINAIATQEAGVIASMLSNLAPSETLVISSRDPRVVSKLDTTQIVFSGGQWKAAVELTPLSMSISSGLWLFGFICIIWGQRKRRAQIVAALLAPPVLSTPSDPLALSDGDAAGGWEITVDESPFPTHRPPPQLPAKPHFSIKNA
ncbi:MAG TPA: hypothetical protein VGP94_09190, partial [Tepidisphaeraceae bacterium]|nr:hypothetical protein [Tepidisphaeraceae bacterium]